MFIRKPLAAVVANVFIFSSFSSVAVYAAETKSTRSKSMENILVTMPLQKTQAETALPVTVLDSEDLQRQAASSIGKTLEQTPGLANASFGAGVGQPVIRGQYGPRVQTLANGTSSSDVSAVSADHVVVVESMLADSIEVLRGPATLLYGGGAIGGVINVIDNRIPGHVPEKTALEVETRYSSHDDGATSVVKAEGGQNNIAWHFDGLYHDWHNSDIPGLAFDTTVDPAYSGDGVLPNTGGHSSTLAGGASWVLDEGHLGFSVSDMKNLYGIPLSDEAQGEVVNGVKIDMHQTRYDINGSWDNLPAVWESARAHVTYTDYQHKEIENTGEVGTVFDKDSWEGRFELTHAAIAGWQGAVGIQVKDSDLSAVGEESFIPASNTQAQGLFIIENLRQGKWLYELGLRYDHEQIDPDMLSAEGESFSGFSYSGSVLWDINDVWNLGVSFSRAERAPTVEELYSNFGNEADSLVAHEATQAVEVGDVNLSQEVSNNLDLTLNYTSDRAYGYMTVYHNQFSDFIALEDTGLIAEDLPVLAYQQADVDFTGAEFKVTFPLPNNLSLNIFGDTVEGTFKAGGDVPRLPPLRVGSGLEYNTDNLSAYVNYVNAASQTDRDAAGDALRKTDGYYRVDLGVEYHMDIQAKNDVLLFARVNNLTDQEIRNHVSLLKNIAPEPGRSLEVGIRFKL